MDEKMQSLNLQTKTNDVDEKGIVTVAVNGIGIEDDQHDISMPGSFDVTLKNDIGRMRWFLNHRQDQLLGVPISGEEKDGNLIMRGQINLDKEIGRDTLADYKLYAEHGRTLEHSIGVKAVKRDRADKRKVLQWFMGEYSTLTNWGSNPQTFLVDIKNATQQQVRGAVNFLRKALTERGYTQKRLKNYDMQLNLLLKALEGGTIVTCPECGMQFDYDSLTEHSFTREVIDNAANMIDWMTRGIVSEEMDKLKPQIRAEVLSILDSIKSGRSSLTEKSITDVASYVRCPHCWARVYRRDSLLAEDKTKDCSRDDDDDDNGNGTEDGDKKPESGCKSSSFWAQLNKSFTN